MRRLPVVALCFFILFVNSLQAMKAIVTVNTGSTPTLIANTTPKSHCHSLLLSPLQQQHIHDTNNSEALDLSDCKQKPNTASKSLALFELNCEINCCDRCSTSNLTINNSDYYHTQLSFLPVYYPDDAIHSYPYLSPNKLYRPPKVS